MEAWYNIYMDSNCPICRKTNPNQFGFCPKCQKEFETFLRDLERAKKLEDFLVKISRKLWRIKLWIMSRQ